MPLQKYQFIIKQNDTLPAIQIKITDRGCLLQKQSFSLSGVTGCTFTMKDSYGNYKVLAQNAQITCYSGGTLQYNWQDGDTDQQGVFYGGFELNFYNGKRMSLPQNDYIKILIEQDFNPFG